MIVGRALDQGQRPVFDDGDEVVREGEDGLPSDDHGGRPQRAPSASTSFRWRRLPPITLARSTPATRWVPAAQDFAAAYLAAFREQFLHIQGDYRKRRRAFDTLFKHCQYDAGGSFAYRWECVLRRLDQTEADALVEAIRKRIAVLNPRQP